MRKVESINIKLRFNDADIKKMCTLYTNGNTIYQIAHQYSICGESVRRILINQNISRRIPSICHRKYSFNESVFDQITEESAYWIGFLMADGCILDTQKNRSNVIALKLKASDINHIYKFRSFLKSSHKIYTIKEKYKNEKYKKVYYYKASLSIPSNKLANKLISYGVTPRKTFTAKVCKKLENNRHFWRGMIDGDGCIHIRKNNDLAVHYCSASYNLIVQYDNFISTLVDKDIKARKIPTTLFQASVQGTKAIKVISHLYQNSNIHLDRKYKKAMEIINGNS